MRLSGYGFFLFRNLRKHPFRTLVSLGGIATAAAVLFLLAGLGLGLRREIYPRLEAAFPEKEIIATPTSTNLLKYFKWTPKTLTPELIAEVRKFEGVDDVSPVLPLRLPACGEAEILPGQGVSIDLALFGVPEELLAKDVKHSRGFTYDPERDVPVIVSMFFLDLYNSVFAEANGMPRLSEATAVGRQFDLVLGQSTALVKETHEIARLRCVIVGMTDRAGMLGGMLPIEYVRRMNQAYLQTDDEYYSSAIVRVRSLADFDAVASELQKRGLTLGGGAELLRKVRGLTLGGLGLMALLAAGIALLAASALFNAFSLMLNERQNLIGLVLGLGATKTCVRQLLLTEALLVGAVGGLLGCAGGHAIAWLVNANLEKLFANSVLMPKILFVAGWEIWLPCLLLSILGALATPLLIVWRTTSRPPALLLGEA